MQEELRFLLISDIHFGHLASSADFALASHPPQSHNQNVIPMKASLIKGLSKDLPISSILASGDLTSTAQPSEFSEFIQAIAEIADALKVPNDDVFLTFGNHDVNWRVSSLAEECGKIPDPLYTILAGHAGPLFTPMPLASRPGPLPGCAVYERSHFVVFSLNSGFYCSHDQAYPHGLLREQLPWLKQVLDGNDSSERWRIVLLHHHVNNFPYPTVTPDISAIEEAAELIDMLGKSRIDIVCHGHRHHPYLVTRMETGWHSPVSFLCAGSLAVNATERRQGEIPNMYHVVHLRDRGPDGGARGRVRSYKYGTSEGWTPVVYSSLTPLDGDQCFGSIASEQERTDAIRKMIQSAVQDDPLFADLPEHAALPFALQCLNMGELNSSIRRIALDEFSRNMIASYPEPNVLLKKTRQ